MKTIKARYNCGKWIWDCEICNSGNSISPGDEMAFCGGCYPDKFAEKIVSIQGALVRGIDREKQDLAKRAAWVNDDVYKIEFPAKHKAIESTLRCRKAEHQSWEVGQTIQDLETENQTHPKLKYLKKAEKPVKKETVKRKVELPALDKETLGRIR